MKQDGARAYLESLIRGATDYGYVLAGIKTGIFDALQKSGADGGSAADLAVMLGYREDYLRIWCETAFALGVLDDAGEGRFCLANGFEALLTAGPFPTSLTPAFRAHEPWIRERLDLAAVIETGEQRPPNLPGTDLARARMSVPAKRAKADLATELIYLRIPAVAERLHQGARVLEVGCGVGTQLESLARAFPTASFVGIDLLPPALEVAGELIADSGLSDRVSFRRLGAEHLDDVDAFDLVTMNIVLHELQPAIRPAAVTAMCRSLRPGGVLVSNDFLYPNRREDFRKPEFALGVFDQALEMTWGNRHLTQDQLRELYLESGFARCELQHISLPLPSNGRPGSLEECLTALAFK
jgi:SAM-dependent methyltransferase